MGKYRSRLEIIADMLSIAKNGARKTRIMYQANLSYKILSRYLDEVLDAGLVTFGSDYYTLTRKGEEYLNRYEEYAKRSKRVEDQLNDVDNEKMMLEKMFLNAQTRDDGYNCKKKRAIVRDS